MKPLRIQLLGRVGAVIIWAIIAGASVLHAEPPAVPPAANLQSATEKWLAEQEPQWQAAFAAEVTAPFDKGLADLAKQYLSALDGQLAAATRAGQLAEAVALRDEKQRLAGGGLFGEDDANTPAALKALRAGYRKSQAVLEGERAARAKASMPATTRCWRKTKRSSLRSSVSTKPSCSNPNARNSQPRGSRRSPCRK